MLRKVLTISALAIAIFFVSRTPVFAAETASPFTLAAGEQKFAISTDVFKGWQTQSSEQTVSYTFNNPQSFQDQLRIQLGGVKEPSSHIYFSSYNVAEIYKYLKSLEPQINKPTSEPRYKEENGVVTDFDPGQTGMALGINKSLDAVIAALEKNYANADLSYNTTEPLQKLADLNDRGIKELVAAGDSNFAGSPNNRIFNIKVGVKKEAGVLLAPGEEFSFNKYLGEVDGAHGFLPELVIKANGTVPEFGGGLCQVSSTVFRAAVNAGLPITARRNHSYAVSYYSPQGTDATIYPGSQDLKFVNNTSGYLLVWPTFPEKNKLRFSLYGTKDSRQVTLDGPYSYDRKSDGSLKAVWRRTTTMPDGQVVNDTFNSNYLSPALFHKVATTPAAPTAPAPTTTPAPDPAQPTT